MELYRPIWDNEKKHFELKVQPPPGAAGYQRLGKYELVKNCSHQLALQQGRPTDIRRKPSESGEPSELKLRDRRVDTLRAAIRKEQK